MANVLIIKLGYSETMDSGVGSITSLGDVLRSTVLLYRFSADKVTWLVTKEAFPLLDGNPYINRIAIYSPDAGCRLQSEKFDIVVNLEKTPEICELADSITAHKRFGFRFDAQKGEVGAYEGCERAFSLSMSSGLRRKSRVCWQESLLSIVGAGWKGQEYILGYRPATFEAYDVGMNWAVGTKWPHKAWPMERWEQLGDLLAGRYSHCMQQGLDNLYRYIDWINSCRVLVTNDSLGLHIAVALKKKVVVMYGPTNPNETHFYGRAEVIYPDSEYDCIPCLKGTCERQRPCMAFISAVEVGRRVERLLGTVDENPEK